MLKDLVQRILGGRRGLALHYLLEDETLSEKELDELRNSEMWQAGAAVRKLRPENKA